MRLISIFLILLLATSFTTKENNLPSLSEQEVTELKDRGFLIRNLNKFTYLNNRMQKVWEKEIEGLSANNGITKAVEDKILFIQFNNTQNVNEITIYQMDLVGNIEKIQIPLFADIQDIITYNCSEVKLIYLAKYDYSQVENFILGEVSFSDFGHSTKCIDITQAKEFEYLQIKNLSPASTAKR
ncbi:MAG: hypothetical protein JKY33_00055 [Bacteroidia bacterium]|nr:hypothetical protein [Bacteroidia bacterium]